MEFNAILSDLKKKNYKPVYVLSGEEPFYIDKISDYIEKNVLDDAEKEFNQTILYGRDVDVNTIVSEAKRYPMMAERQVLIVKEAQHVEEIEELESYVQQPLNSTLLVICYKYKTLDKRKSFAKSVSKNGVLFESEKLRDYKIPDWIAGFLKEKKYSAGPKALQMLTDYLGTDLGKIVNELEKIMIIIPSGAEITPELIEANIGISKDYNSFELTSAFAKRDILKANRIVNYFADNPKEHPFPVTMSLLFNYFSKLLRYHFLTDHSRENVAKSLGIHPFYVNEYVTAANAYSVKKIKAVFSFLREYDLRWKGVDNVNADEGELLKELTWKIIH
ncbi:MAG: DNA polymerase III subunit delta [Bacteroidetes bacterium]|nr:DNA polymerase III subunit delta [Bacteroidota bacterium]